MQQFCFQIHTHSKTYHQSTRISFSWPTGSWLVPQRFTKIRDTQIIRASSSTQQEHSGIRHPKRRAQTAIVPCFSTAILILVTAIPCNNLIFRNLESYKYMRVYICLDTYVYNNISIIHTSQGRSGQNIWHLCIYG